jgi:tRNA threonylcarbamoyladenosine biosynthesis protein TsaB
MAGVPLRYRAERATPAPTGPTLLAIETAGSGCSAAVTRGAAVLAAERRELRYGHAEVLLPMVERVVAAAGLARSALQVVAAAIGPGGFTGIRVGLAAAHGIALACGAQLIGVSSFAAVAAGIGADADEGVGHCRVVLVALDSRREDLYVQLFASEAAADMAVPVALPATIVPGLLADHVARVMAGIGAAGRLVVAGDAAEAAAAALAGRLPFALAAGSAPDALGVAAAALHGLRTEATSEPVRPLYLRPPDVTLPKRREPNPAPAQ